MITGQRSFSSLAYWLFDRAPEQKNSFENVHCELGQFFLQILQCFENY